MKIALICGGPSLERGISFNSARSVLDHLESESIEIVPIYIDQRRRAYKISKAQLYSNTPSDFDFKLKQTATPLTEQGLIRVLKKTDIAFPVMHGAFGEDGGIQCLLEKHSVPFVGSSSEVCKLIFDKFKANQFIQKHSFFALPSVVLKIYHKDHRQIVEKFFKENNIKRAIVKPAIGGSSIGVFSVSTPGEALEKVRLLFSKRMGTRVVLEPFARGVEFTAIILENRFGLPVCILPTEIEADYTNHQIFDFRKKYLPTRQVTWHCPPRFENHIIEKLQVQAEQLFSLFGMRDFARFDGWVMPNGEIWFSDFNPVSGMEQNSFLFQQASRVGLSHKGVLQHIVRQACKRYNIHFPRESKSNTKVHRKPIDVLFGGGNSERQVSLMSGTNVWLKLRDSNKYRPRPFLLDLDGRVWPLPYHLALNHTVEEIVENCKGAKIHKGRLGLLENKVKMRLGVLDNPDREERFIPTATTLTDFIKKSNFVFIALHGGEGEDGTLQNLLTDKDIKYNGPGGEVSRMCMDKVDTDSAVDTLGIKGVHVIPGKVVNLKELEILSSGDLGLFWKNLRKELKSRTLVVKPRADGCSSGIVRLWSADDLKKYIKLLKDRAVSIKENSFKGQTSIIEMPVEPIEDLLFQKFIETDVVRIKGNKLKHYRQSGLIEVTVAVVEEEGKLRVFSPSITVAEGEVLTVEEKFQGGTGVNITPPPISIVSRKALRKAKSLIGRVAEGLDIRGYSRIDAFMHIDSGNVIIIEVNTLPALTPSTVLYHQALAEKPSIHPRELLEKLIENKGY